MTGFEEYIRQGEPDKTAKSGIWQAAIGLQKVDGLTTSDYLIDSEPFARDSWYFRNALVRANYEDLAHGIHKTPTFLVRFFENLLLGAGNELRNRHLHVDWAGQESVPADGGVKVVDGGVNGGVSSLQKRILDLIRQNPHITAAEIKNKL